MAACVLLLLRPQHQCLAKLPWSVAADAATVMLRLLKADGFANANAGPVQHPHSIPLVNTAADATVVTCCCGLAAPMTCIADF